MTGILRRLHPESGQSAWLDNLQRSYLRDGTLAALVQRGVRGLTSNPTIFQKAIQGSDDYDGQFSELISTGHSVLEAYWELVISDIHGALEVFRPLHESSGSVDGFVSVEVDPRLARDGVGTLREARLLHESISKPNVMIKIPATQEGLGAITRMIAEGRSVNVTLIFSLERYAQVMEAYVAGLEERASKGSPVAGVSSVASFFISRVDTEIDKRLDGLGSDPARRAKGKAAVAQARLAYRMFQDTFAGDRWERLADLGAQVQRPLWASTSTKDPSYPDTLYVDSLIGPRSVNTLPEPTLEAFDDHGSISRTIDADVDEAERFWFGLQDLGIDTSEVAVKLEQEGVDSFIRSFDDLLTVLATKAENLGN